MSEKTNIEEPNVVEQKEPTIEELKVMRDRMIKYYKEQNAVLVHQNEYEKHMADIEEHRVRRLSMNMRMIQLTTPEEEPAAKAERKLKSQE